MLNIFSLLIINVNVFFFTFIISSKNPTNPTSNVRFLISHNKLFFTIDPRKHNDDILMKKIISDNEKIHLLNQLQSTRISTSYKLQLINRNKHNHFPINVNRDDLFNEWNGKNGNFTDVYL